MYEGNYHHVTKERDIWGIEKSCNLHRVTELVYVMDRVQIENL